MFSAFPPFKSSFCCRNDNRRPGLPLLHLHAFWQEFSYSFNHRPIELHQMLYRKRIHNRPADTVLNVSASMIYCTVTSESYRCLDGTTIAKNVQQGQAPKGDTSHRHKYERRQCAPAQLTIDPKTRQRLREKGVLHGRSGRRGGRGPGERVRPG